MLVSPTGLLRELVCDWLALKKMFDAFWNLQFVLLFIIVSDMFPLSCLRATEVEKAEYNKASVFNKVSWLAISTAKIQIPNEDKTIAFSIGEPNCNNKILARLPHYRTTITVSLV